MMLAALCLLSLAGVLLVEMGWLGGGAEPALLMILAVLCAAPAVHGWITRSFDPFEPVYPMVIATAIYFILMPVLLLSAGRVEMMGVDYSRELPAALMLAILAISAFYAGYYGLAGRTSAAQGADRLDAERVRWTALLFLAVSGAMFVLWIFLARIPLRTLIIFSGAGYGAWVEAASGPRLGHLYALQDVWPACILLLVGSRHARNWMFGPAVILAVVVAVYASIGIRARVLVALCSALAFHYLIRGRRPSLLRLGVFGLLVLVLVIGGIGYYRGKPPETASPHLGVSTGWRHLVEGSDIATTTSAYVHWLRRYGYEGGRNFLALALLPVPSAIWPDKYKYLGESPIENHLSIGAAAAYFVELYRAFGSALVVFGTAFLGRLFRRIYDRSCASGATLFEHAYLALLWAFAFHMYGRNSVTLLVGGAAFVFGPVWICRRLSLAPGTEPGILVAAQRMSVPGRY